MRSPPASCPIPGGSGFARYLAVFRETSHAIVCVVADSLPCIQTTNARTLELVFAKDEVHPPVSRRKKNVLLSCICSRLPFHTHARKKELLKNRAEDFMYATAPERREVHQYEEKCADLQRILMSSDVVGTPSLSQSLPLCRTFHTKTNHNFSYSASRTMHPRFQTARRNNPHSRRFSVGYLQQRALPSGRTKCQISRMFRQTCRTHDRRDFYFTLWCTTR